MGRFKPAQGIKGAKDCPTERISRPRGPLGWLTNSTTFFRRRHELGVCQLKPADGPKDKKGSTMSVLEERYGEEQEAQSC
jgi:hypothetical protein